MTPFSKLIGWLKDATRPLRQALPLARLPEQSPVHDIPTAIGLAHGRLFGREFISLTFSNAYAYKSRYLHRGLTQHSVQRRCARFATRSWDIISLWGERPPSFAKRQMPGLSIEFKILSIQALYVPYT